MKTALDIQTLEKVAFMLKTIAHPQRIAIVELLTFKPRLPVNEICNLLNAEQSITSHHLSYMKLKGVLGSSREGKNVFYYLKMQEVTKVIDCMKSCDL